MDEVDDLDGAPSDKSAMQYTPPGWLQWTLVVEQKWFDYCIMGLIFVNCVQLALYDPYDTDDNSTHNRVNDYVDYVSLGLFSVELLLKLAAFGLVGYWDSGWNRLDALVVATGFISLAPGMDSLVLTRLLRVLRPLRIVNKLEGMKQILSTLAKSARPLLDTALLCCALLFIFGIIAVTLFQGYTRQHCYTASNGEYTLNEDVGRQCGGKFTCPAGDVCLYSREAPNFGLTSFDHISVAFLTIFVAVTLEGWTDVMYMMQDTYGYWVATIFFHFLIIFCSIFALNLALAVLAEAFSSNVQDPEDEEAEEAESEHESDSEWSDSGTPLEHTMEVHNKVARSRSHSIADLRMLRTASRIEEDKQYREKRKMRADELVRPENCFRGWFFDLAVHDYFSKTIIVFILLNTVTLSMEHKRTSVINGVSQANDMSDSFRLFLDIANYLFTAIFVIEAAVKLTGLGPRNYFRERFNCFDFAIVISSLAELAAAGGGALSVLRTFRLMRIMKLSKRWRSMRMILQTVMQTLPQMSYLMLVAALFIFISAIAGMQLFGSKLNAPALEAKPRENFDNFGVAMLTVFQMLTGENWNEVMYNSIQATSEWSVIYFLMVIVIGTFVVLNLTLAILLSNFGSADPDDEEAANDGDIDAGLVGWAKDFLARSCCAQCTATVEPEDEDESKTDKAPIGGLAGMDHQQLAWNNNTDIICDNDLISTRKAEVTQGKPTRKVDSISGQEDGDTQIFDAGLPAVSGLNSPDATSSADGSGKGSGAGVPDGSEQPSEPFPQQTQSTLPDDAVEPEQATDPVIPPVRTPRSSSTHGTPTPSRTPSLPPISEAVGEAQAADEAQALASRTQSEIIADEAQAESTLKLSSTVKRLQNRLFLKKVFTDLRTKFTLHQANEKGGGEEQAISSSVMDGVQAQKHLEDAEQAAEDARRDCTGFVLPELPPLTGKSLWLLKPDSQCRNSLHKLVTHPLFENMILFLIMVSSVTLAMDQPMLDEDSELAGVLEILDIIFTTVFVIEMCLKIVVYGFLLHENAYLHDGWNCLDFFIVIISVGSVSGVLDSGGLKSLRTLRALRPLRTIKRAPGLKMSVETIIQCLPSFLNIAVVASVFYLIFAIMGVQFWAGKFWKCSDESVKNVTECAAAGGEWQNAPSNYDDVINGMLTLFEVSSLEMWLVIMYNSMDAIPGDELGEQPVVNTQWWSALFYVVFICFGSFLVMNLFVGAVVDTFGEIKKDEQRSAMMSDDQARFVASMKDMFSNKPAPTPKAPEGDCRKMFYDFVQFERGSWSFDNVIAGLIGANILVMSLSWWELPALGVVADSDAAADLQETPFNQGLEWANLCFTVIFAIEATLKLIGLGAKQYFDSKLNLFDFVVVAVSVIGTVIDFAAGDASAGLVSALMVFRVARVLRICRLALRFTGIRRLLQTLLFTLPAVLNVFMLLFLVIFIFTVLGMSFFGKNPYATAEDHGHYGLYNEHANFRYFHIGFFMLFRMTTGESWNGIMHDCMQQSGGMSSFFFVGFMIIATSLLLNLVIAILLDEFSSKVAAESSAITPEALDRFTKAWESFDLDASMKIKMKLLPEFLQQVGEPLGVSSDSTHNQAAMVAVELQVPMVAGYLHFTEVFSACARRALHVDTLDAQVLAEMMSAVALTFPDLSEEEPAGTR